jgi:hypothetical protein
MLRKDRTVIEPKCQFGIECNYLRGEVEGTGGPPCRYFHPREHYEKLSKGRNVNQGSFDPLRAQSKVSVVRGLFFLLAQGFLFVR